MFATFIINDVLREEASGLVDSLNRAIVLSELRGDTARVLTRVGQTEQLVRVISNKDEHPVGKSEQPCGNAASPSTEENAAWVRLGAEGQELQLTTLKELANQAFPDDKTFPNELEIVRKQIDIGQKIDTGLLDFVGTCKPSKTDIEKSAAAMAAVMVQYPKDTDSFAPLPTTIKLPDSFKLQGEVRLEWDSQRLFELVREKAKQSQKRAQRWKHISFALYPIGWFLGLAGKLFGAENDAD